MRPIARRNDERDTGPLTEPVFFILASLAGQPRHGYALLRDIPEISEGRVCPSTGTLYGALRRMLEDGLIERFRQDDTSRDKQAYRISAEGRRQLRAEVERMRRLTRIAHARLKAMES